MQKWQKWLPLIVLGVMFLVTACEESTSVNPSIPDYTVIGLPEPEEHGKKLIWNTTPGGAIIFDDPLVSTSAVTYTMEGILDGDDENMRVNILDNENPGSVGIQVDIFRTTSGGLPVANSLDLDINEIATNAPCPTQTLVNAAYAMGSTFSYTIKVDQSGVRPKVSVWLTGDPAVDTATYTSAAADCTVNSSTWVKSAEARVALEADSVTHTLVEF